MNCNEAHALINAYADGELDLVRSLDVERHLASCARCVASHKAILSLRNAMKQADLAYRAPESLRKTVMELLEDARPETKATPAMNAWWRWVAIGATAFAVLTLLLRPVGISRRDLLTDETIDDHVRSLLASHLMDVASTDQHTVKPWFNGRLDFAPNVKDFATQDFPLIGGRLDYLDGRRVAALIYQRNKHYINVFIWPSGAVASGAPEVTTRRGYSIINEDINGMHYCLVSDLNIQELGGLAGMLGK